MKTLVWIVCACVLLFGGIFVLKNYLYTNTKMQEAARMTKAEPQVFPISHATFALVWSGTTFYVDPTGGASAFAGLSAPNIILLTDIHGDHLEPETLSVIAENATIIAPQAVKDALPAELAARVVVMQNGQRREEQGFSIIAMPMYNLPGENAKWHVKGRGNGYVIERDGIRVYIAGDTAGIPEMRALKNIDIAFIPMNLPYTMGVDEAADAVLEFAPKVVYPYHYRSPDGLADVERFKQLVNTGNPDIEVVLAKWY